MGFYQILGLRKIFIKFQNHGVPHLERPILQHTLLYYVRLLKKCKIKVIYSDKNNPNQAHFEKLVI